MSQILLIFWCFERKLKRSGGLRWPRQGFHFPDCGAEVFIKSQVCTKLVKTECCTLWSPCFDEFCFERFSDAEFGALAEAPWSLEPNFFPYWITNDRSPCPECQWILEQFYNLETGCYADWGLILKVKINLRLSSFLAVWLKKF